MPGSILHRSALRMELPTARASVEFLISEGVNFEKQSHGMNPCEACWQSTLYSSAVSLPPGIRSPSKPASRPCGERRCADCHC